MALTRVRGVHLAALAVVGAFVLTLRATYTGSLWVLYTWPFLLVLAGLPALYLVRRRIHAQRALTTLQGERAWAKRVELALRNRGLEDVAASLEADRRNGAPTPRALARADAALIPAEQDQDNTSPKRV